MATTILEDTGHVLIAPLVAFYNHTCDTHFQNIFDIDNLDF